METKVTIIRGLIDAVDSISAIKEFRWPLKKQYCNLARRVKLLFPMFEEIRENQDPISEEVLKSLIDLKEALYATKELLRSGTEGSKIYMVLEREHLMKNYHEVTDRLEKALTGLPLENVDISDEVKEQVELVLSQFRKAKGRIDAADDELCGELCSLYDNPDQTVEPAIMKTLSEKLQLTGIAELTHESLALLDMVSATEGDPKGRIEKMSYILRRIKVFVQTENPDMATPSNENILSVRSGRNEQTSAEENRQTPTIPEDFRCPISLELMKDPVIVSTGQTYERACIVKWLEMGHSTCPKTQQPLTSSALTPNYALRSLISQWCEANGIESPKRNPSSLANKTFATSSNAERLKVLLEKLTSINLEDQRYAAGEIRLLAKRNADNRVAIAEAGVIPSLVTLLSTPDSRTQEHAVTALLNLSICEENKASIIAAGAVPGIVHVLKKGSMEARENSAATLFSLSVVDEFKLRIGSLGAIPPLVTLLSEGTARGKKDAATALFNLCICHGNKGKAVRAGVVKTIMHLLTEPGGGMVDEALAILAILSNHPEGKTAIGAEGAVPVLVEVIRNGSPRNKENAAAVLVHLCSGDQKHMFEAQELGVIEPLKDLAQNGTDRGKRKAVLLLDRITRFLEQGKSDQPPTEAVCHSSRILAHI